MSRQGVAGAVSALAALLAGGALSSYALPAPTAGGPAAPSGVWRGASTCTDRVAAPACRDEVVVYEFTDGAKPGIVHWKADKIVEGRREPMGEMDLAWDKGEACWRAEFKSPRVHSVWCLTVDGPRIRGTARLLPGRQVVRKIEVRRDGAVAVGAGIVHGWVLQVIFTEVGKRCCSWS
jgi:hypothetical protein